MKYMLLLIMPLHCLASWNGQWHAAQWYDHFIPMDTINSMYNGYYPYWGYGLGMGRTLDTLAQQQAWQEIAQKLRQEKSVLQNTSFSKLNATRAKRIDLHLEGIN